MKRSSAFAIGLLAAAVSTLPSAAAYAYCRTANCKAHSGAWQVCIPAEADDCGTKLFWGNRCVGFTLQKDASSQVKLDETETAFETAFGAWTKADCGGGSHPSVTVNYQGPVDCQLQEYNKDKANANVIMFRDSAWPYEGTSNILALTTVTYNLDTSEIYDADMELNTADHDFTTSDGGVKYDLLSIATHETGHFLGLAHSHSADATMFADYLPGTVTLRDLTADDIAAVCDTYPPDDPASDDCDAEPRHGFSALCGEDQPEKKEGCALSPAAPESSSLAAFGLVAAAALAARRRRRG